MGFVKDITKIFKREDTPAQIVSKKVSDNVSENVPGDIIKKKKRQTQVNLSSKSESLGTNTTQKTILGV